MTETDSGEERALAFPEGWVSVSSSVRPDGCTERVFHVRDPESQKVVVVIVVVKKAAALPA